MKKSIARFVKHIHNSDIPHECMWHLFPEKAIFLVTDVETTGLEVGRHDHIHEIAIHAINHKFEVLEGFHKRCYVMPDYLPMNIIANAKSIRFLGKFMNEKDQNHYISHLIRRCALFKGFKHQGRVLKGTDTSYMMAVGEIMKKWMQDNNINGGDWRLRLFFYAMRDVAKAYDIHWVLKLTKYDRRDRSGFESDLIRATTNFLQHIEEANEGKNEIVIIGQNTPYDIRMTAQGMVRAEIPYEKYMQFAALKYIDTALLMRMYVNKYLFTTWLLLSRKWQKSGARLANRSKLLQKVLLKLHPVKRNKLDFLSKYFGIENKAHHTADNDIEATRELLQVILAIDIRFWRATRRRPELYTTMLEVENMRTEGTKRITEDFSKQVKGHFNLLVDSAAVQKQFELKYNQIVTEENRKYMSKGEEKKPSFSEMEFTGGHHIDPYRKEHAKKFDEFLKKLKLDRTTFPHYREEDEKDTFAEDRKRIERMYPIIKYKIELDTDGQSIFKTKKATESAEESA